MVSSNRQQATGPLSGKRQPMTRKQMHNMIVSWEFSASAVKERRRFDRFCEWIWAFELALGEADCFGDYKHPSKRIIFAGTSPTACCTYCNREYRVKRQPTVGQMNCCKDRKCRNKRFAEYKRKYRSGALSGDNHAGG